MNKKLREKFVKVPNDMYDNASITNEELTILLLIYRNHQIFRENLALCSIQLLIDLMKVNIKNNTKIISKIKDILINLIDKGYIVNIYDIYGQDIYDLYECNNDYSVTDRIKAEDIIKDKNTLFYIELNAPENDIFFTANNYFMIKDDDIDKIFDYLQATNISKFDLIRYFIACKRVCNNQVDFGYLSQSKVNLLIKDTRTVGRYNKILQDELHLIRYNNSYLTKERHYNTTFIGLYDDKVNFDKQLESEVNRLGLIYTDKSNSNKKRSIKQKINRNIEQLELDENTVLKEKLKQLEAQLEKLQYKPKDDDDMEFIEEYYPEWLEDSKNYED